MTNQANTLIDANFTWQAALALALNSKLVYQRSDAVKSIAVTQWGYDECIFISKSDTQLFVAIKDNKVVISFRGSHGRSDWLNNFRIIGTNDLEAGRIHSGFHSAFQAIKTPLVELLNDLGSDKKIWLTGHSLGGALAAICLAELQESLRDRFQACYTFGQPRVGHGNFANFIKINYGERFFRFVNDDDIVTRIPPVYRHVGSLIHFAADGSLLTFPTTGGDSAIEAIIDEMDTETISTEAPPLTEAQFEQFLASNSEPLETDLIDNSTEGILPSVSDHDIEEYINKIIRHERTSETRDNTELISIDRNIEKSAELAVEHMEPVKDLTFQPIDPSGRIPILLNARRGWTPPHDIKITPFIGAVHEAFVTLPQLKKLKEHNVTVRSMRIESSVESHIQPTDDSDLIPIIIKAVPGWNPPDDITINSTIGTVHTALVTITQLAELQHDTGNIISIDHSSDGFTIDCLVSVPFVKATQVHRPPLSEKGDQALIGIVDTGIDVLHQAFTDINDTTKSRILYVWDQNDTSVSNRSPSDINSKFTANYGRLYTQDEIEQFMHNGSVGSHSKLRDGYSRHGTHVAGIAAGRAVGMIGDGVAPEAKLVVVIPRLEIEEGDPKSIGYSVTHLDGLLFLKEAAQKHELPMAINISLGQNAGSHDGSSTLEAGFDTILDQGRLPGLVIVKSAGNERGHKGHAKVNIATNLIEIISWKSRAIGRGQDYIEGWYDSFDNLDFTLIDPDSNRSETISFDQDTGRDYKPQKKVGTLGGGGYELHLTKNHRDNGQSLIQVIITPNDSSRKIQAGIWQLEILRRTLGTAEGRVDFWIERTNSRAISFEQGADDSMTLSVPGTAKHVIAVAACSPEGPPIRLTSSSSYGPTRRNGKKPEITAPGDRIFAARANTNDSTAGIAQTGTSMAAPHVTGAIALAMSKLHKLDRNRQLNAVQFKSALVRSSMDASGNHHPGRGFGVLDVAGFFNII